MSNPIANATDIATILATTIIAILVSLIAVITLPTTVTTNTNLVVSTDYHQQSFYEYLLQHE